MKTFASFALFTSLLLLSACSHQADSMISDTAVSKSLPGTWHLYIGSTNHAGDKCTVTIATNGDFVLRSVSGFGVPDFVESGFFRVKDGFMVQTITNDNEHIFVRYPHVARARITQADGNTIVFGIMNKQGDKAIMEKLHDVTPN